VDSLSTSLLKVVQEYLCPAFFSLFLSLSVLSGNVESSEYLLFLDLDLSNRCQSSRTAMRPFQIVGAPNSRDMVDILRSKRVDEGNALQGLLDKICRRKIIGILAMLNLHRHHRQYTAPASIDATPRNPKITIPLAGQQLSRHTHLDITRIVAAMKNCEGVRHLYRHHLVAPIASSNTAGVRHLCRHHLVALIASPSLHTMTIIPTPSIPTRFSLTNEWLTNLNSPMINLWIRAMISICTKDTTILGGDRRPSKIKQKPSRFGYVNVSLRVCDPTDSDNLIGG